MERSRKILLKIASISKKVVAAANDYADRKDSLDVQRSHFQLEEEMQKVAVACECLADITGKMPLHDSNGPAIDERLRDWLGTSEPQMCFDTLGQMEKLLQEDMFPRMAATILGSSGTAAAKDKIDEAVSLLESRKGYFHFLFSAEIWNRERGVQRQQSVPRFLEHITQVESSIVEQTLSVPVQTDVNICIQDTAVYQDGHAVPPAHTSVVDTQRASKLDVGRLEEILRWLDGLNCAEKQDITLSFRQPDTCKWLFDTVQYKMWRNGRSSFLWLQGKPGAGKSVLASSVIESLEKSPEEEYLTFFYCDFRNERSTSASEAMRSILSQLLRRLHGSTVDFGSLMDDLVGAKERSGATRNNTKELAAFASRVAGLLSRRPLVVVDALDECRDVETLLEGLVSLKGHARLFVTGRPLQVIRDGFFGLPFISMDDMATELLADIELHVTRELDARRRLRQLDVEFKNQVRSALCSKADGMFRWVQCSIETLNHCVTRREIQMALDSLPDGLDETYERVLLAVDTKAREGRLAQRALIWLVAALRPLRLDELLEGLSIDLETRTLNFDLGPMHSGALLDACGSLVTYTESTGIIVLSHFSVKEYLIGRFIFTKLPRYHINWESANLHLARLCMCYISICLKVFEGSLDSNSTLIDACYGNEVSPIRRDRLDAVSYPLLGYVLDDALHHFEHLGQRFGSILHDIKVLERDIQKYASRWDNICLSAKNAMHFITPSWPTSIHDLNLYILVAFAPDSLLRVFLRHATLLPKDGTNPLVYAACFNKAEHARTLLSRGAQLNRKGWETLSYHQVLPIEVALQYRHYPIVTLFVAEGSTIPLHIFSDSSFGPANFLTPYSIGKILIQTDYFVEAANDPANKSVMRLVDMFRDFPWTRDADEQDLIAIIRRFSQVVDDHSVWKSDGETLLHSVIEGGYCSAAQYLLTFGIPVPPDIFVSLNSSGRWRKGSMIRFLVENGANIFARTVDGDTILHSLLNAVSDDDEDTLQSTQLLVARGCNPLSPNLRGQTPLHIAVERGHVSVVHFLLSRFCVRNPLSPDLLLLAAQHLHRKKRNTIQSIQSILHLLVENGADPLTYAGRGHSLLQDILWCLDSEYGALEVTRFLLNHGCDPLQPDIFGKTPLHVAVKRVFVSVVRYVLSTIHVGTPLPPDLVLHIRWYAPRSKCDERLSMLCLLVQNGAGVLAHTLDGGSVLHKVLEFFGDDDDTFEATKLLIAHGCNPHEVSRYGRTPLHIAIQRMFVSTAQYLLSCGVPLPPDPLLVALDRDNRQKLPMGDATFMMVHLLIDSGADARARTRTGDSLLHIGLQSLAEDDHALEVARLLVSHGCDPLEPNSSGKTLLRIAIECGHVSVAQYLLSLGGSLHPASDLSQLLSRSRAAPMICFFVENFITAVTRTTTGDSMLHFVLRWYWRKEEESYALEATKVLVSHGYHPFEADSLGQTPVHIAIQRGYVSVMRYLLSLGASPSPDLLFVTLNVVFMGGVKASIVHCLVECGADVHVRTSTGDSVLHIALRSFYEEDYALETVKLLVHNGCDPFGANSNGETPLHVALKRAQISVTRYLFSLGASPPPDLLLIALGEAPLWDDRRASFAHCLVDNGADVHVRTLTGDSVLHLALKSFGEDYVLETAEFLVAHGCDTQSANSSGQTPLHIAVQRGHVLITRYLLRTCGVSPSSDLLLVALNSELTAHKKASIVCCLVENGANVNVRTGSGDSVLHVALRSFSEERWILEVIRLLISHGCDPHEADSRGEAPLCNAVKRGQVSVASHLLSLGAAFPRDALLLALDSEQQGSRRLQMIDFLIDQGVSVLVRAPNGDTVLHRAIASLHDNEVLECMTLLISHGCQPTVPNDRGATPLHVAVEQGRTAVVKHLLALNIPPPPDIMFTAIQGETTCLEIIKVLVTFGYDTRIRNASGHTPLGVSIVKGYVDVVDYLLSVVDIPSCEDFFSMIALAPPNSRGEMRRMLHNRLRTTSESAEPPVKHTRHS